MDGYGAIITPSLKPFKLVGLNTSEELIFMVYS